MLRGFADNVQRVKNEKHKSQKHLERTENQSEKLERLRGQRWMWRQTERGLQLAPRPFLNLNCAFHKNLNFS